MAIKTHLKVSFGPVCYEFRAGDQWGEEALARIQKHIAAAASGKTADRVIYLFDNKSELECILSGILPKSLKDFWSADLPGEGWRATAEKSGTMIYSHHKIKTAFWTHDQHWENKKPLLWFPWSLLDHDLCQKGGAIIHGALARHGGQKDAAFIFTAPPNGGKTTTMKRLRHPWKVLSDDAAIVWSSEKNKYRASPLPTYSVTLGGPLPMNESAKWECGNETDLSAIIFLEKADLDKFSEVDALAAARPLYLAFSEHPAVVEGRKLNQRKRFCRIACSIARSRPIYKLELKLKGDLTGISKQIYYKNKYFLFRYKGESMRPTFQENDLLEIEKIPSEKIRKGDCVVYKIHSRDSHCAAHRVIKTKPEIMTKGDAFSRQDDLPLPQSDIIGRVKGRIRKGRYRRVYGGSIGIIESWISKLRLAIKTHLTG